MFRDKLVKLSIRNSSGSSCAFTGLTLCQARPDSLSIVQAFVNKRSPTSISTVAIPFSETVIRIIQAACSSGLGDTTSIAGLGLSLLYLNSHSVASNWTPPIDKKKCMSSH